MNTNIDTKKLDKLYAQYSALCALEFHKWEDAENKKRERKIWKKLADMEALFPTKEEFKKWFKEKCNEGSPWKFI